MRGVTQLLLCFAVFHWCLQGRICGADDKSAMDSIKEKYQSKIEKARSDLSGKLQKLHDQAREGKQVTAARLTPDQLLLLSDRLQKERELLLDHSEVPLSSPAIRHTLAYLEEVRAAQFALSQGFNKEIAKAQRAKDTGLAKTLSAELATLCEPVVLFTFDYTYGVGLTDPWVFMSDGHLGKDTKQVDRPTYELSERGLVIKGKTWTDKVQWNFLGTTVEGTGHTGYPKSGTRHDP